MGLLNLYYHFVKVWDTRRQGPRLLKEVKAHMKSALCLAYHKSANQLYTGSADKTIRVIYHQLCPLSLQFLTFM